MAEEVAAEERSTQGGSGLKSFLSGGFGGLCLVLVGHPLDLIKVKMQTGVGTHGLVDVARQTLKAEGPVGLYRGVSAPLLGITPIFAVCFWGYDLGQYLIREIAGPAHQELSLAQLAAAGAFSAIPATVIAAPVERVKCLLQTQSLGSEGSSGPKYKGMADCAGQLLRTGGISSLFRGWEATLLRDGPGSAAYFGVNAFLKKRFADTEGRVSTAGILTAGGVAGCANWAIAMPPDMLKSRLQTAPEGKYTGIIDVYRQLIRDEGHSALFRGLRPAMLRAFPANAACFFGVDVATRALESTGFF